MVFAQDYEPNFPYNVLNKKNKKGVVQYEIIDDFLSLDTETSHNHNEENLIGWIYQWAFVIGQDIVGGRKPSQLISCLNKIIEYANLSDKRKMVIYVHNLSYDIEYLRQWLMNEYGEDANYIAVGSHKFISFEIGCFIFRCSYKLSNKSLDMWSKDMNTEHRKLIGFVDYDKIHTQTEELTERDWEYQINDVLALRECIIKQMEIYNDNLLTIPLTSTGYIRRTCRNNFFKDRNNKKHFLETRLTLEQYKMCRTAFSGGLTHGNRHFMEQTIDIEEINKQFNEYDGTNIRYFMKHRDFRSHYPSQQRTRKFPIGNFNRYTGDDITKEEIDFLQKHYCLLFDITLVNPEVKDGYVIFPVISESKARRNIVSEDIDFISDNGRVLKCNGIFTLTVTELDYYWIMKQYNMDTYIIDNMYIAKSGYLPKFMIDTIDEFMLGKTKFKDLGKKEKDKLKKIELGIELMKAKNGLNGIYGMSATDPIRELFLLDYETGKWTEEELAEDKIGEALDKYYSNYNSFMRYQWGVWTTAFARDELLRYAEIIQSNGGVPLYCDTDSIFYISNDIVEQAVNAENKRREQEAIRLGAYINYEGKIVNYDAFEDEDEDITQFKFLHAKCYAYVENEELHVTIAGVKARELVDMDGDTPIYYTREEELGSIDNLANDAKFTVCGGTTSVYVPHPICFADGVEFASACIIKKSEKTLKNELTNYDSVIKWEVV